MTHLNKNVRTKTLYLDVWNDWYVLTAFYDCK